MNEKELLDQEIIEKYIARSEDAIRLTRTHYGKLCGSIAHNILRNYEDAEECVNDTYFRVWNTIPPERPLQLSAYLSRITRNLALDRYRQNHAAKRNGDGIDAIYEELENCLSSQSAESPETAAIDQLELNRIMNTFVAGLQADVRKLFVCRYFYMMPIRDIAQKYGIGQSKVKMTLSRTRTRLKQLLEKEGFII